MPIMQPNKLLSSNRYRKHQINYTAFEVIYMDARYYRYAVANMCHTGKQSVDILPTSVISMTLDHSLRNESARRRHADLPESCLVKTVNHLLKSFQLQSVVKS